MAEDKDDVLVPMALSKAEIKDRAKDFSCVPSINPPQYPWGLQIDLNETSLDKLGLATPKVGSYVLVTARCCVTGTSESKREGDSGKEERRSVSLQVEDMSVQPDKATRGSAKRYTAPAKAGVAKHTARKRAGA